MVRRGLHLQRRRPAQRLQSDQGLAEIMGRDGRLGQEERALLLRWYVLFLLWQRCGRGGCQGCALATTTRGPWLEVFDRRYRDRRF